MGPAVVLLDRDGVLNVDLPGSVGSLSELRMIDDAPGAVALLTEKGYRVLVVTNQAVVARGRMSRDELDRIHELMDAIVSRAGGRIDRWYVCDHDDAAGCACRKPKPGLIEQARRDFAFTAADTWFVGDAERDVVAAQAAGCRPGIVLTGKGRSTSIRFPRIPSFATLTEFARSLPRG